VQLLSIEGTVSSVFLLSEDLVVTDLTLELASFFPLLEGRALLFLRTGSKVCLVEMLVGPACWSCSVCPLLRLLLNSYSREEETRTLYSVESLCAWSLPLLELTASEGT